MNKLSFIITVYRQSFMYCLHRLKLMIDFLTFTRENQRKDNYMGITLFRIKTEVSSMIPSDRYYEEKSILFFRTKVSF